MGVTSKKLRQMHMKWYQCYKTAERTWDKKTDIAFCMKDLVKLSRRPIVFHFTYHVVRAVFLSRYLPIWLWIAHDFSFEGFFVEFPHCLLHWQSFESMHFCCVSTHNAIFKFQIIVFFALVWFFCCTLLLK